MASPAWLPHEAQPPVFAETPSTPNAATSMSAAPLRSDTGTGNTILLGFGTRGGADSDNWNKKKGEFSSVGSERTESVGGRPKLVLQPPHTGSVSNENQSQDVVVGASPGNLAKHKGPNPFGEARPREQVLAEKGQDWKKIDEQLESLKIKETNVNGFRKRGFGSAIANRLSEDRSERSWKKTPSDDDGHSESTEKVEKENVEEN